MDIPLEVCEARDVKGLYKLARAGKIKGKKNNTYKNEDFKFRISNLLYFYLFCISNFDRVEKTVILSMDGVD